MEVLYGLVIAAEAEVINAVGTGDDKESPEECPCESPDFEEGDDE